MIDFRYDHPRRQERLFTAHSNLRPRALPIYRRNLQRWSACLRIIRMEHDEVVGRSRQDRLAARTGPFPISMQQLRPAAFQHRFAILVEIGPGDLLRSANHDAISAVRSFAAQIPRDKKVVITIATNNKRSFNGLPIRGQARRCRQASSGRARFASE